MNVRSLLLSTSVLALVACGSGDGTVSVKPVLSGGAAPVSAPAFRPMGGMPAEDVTITGVTVVLSDISLREGGAGNGKNSQGDDGSASVNFDGTYVVDLFADAVTPALQAVTVPTGAYGRLSFSLDQLSADEAPDMGLPVSHPVVGQSYVIEALLHDVDLAGGSVTDTVRLVISGGQEDTFNVGLKEAVTVEADEEKQLLLVFNADGWFPSQVMGQLRSGVKTGSVTVEEVDGDKVVYLDANRNHSFASQLKKAFRDSVVVLEDVDGNGETD